jgi:hypothetical protein
MHKPSALMLLPLLLGTLGALFKHARQLEDVLSASLYSNTAEYISTEAANQSHVLEHWRPARTLVSRGRCTASFE